MNTKALEVKKLQVRRAGRAILDVDHMQVYRGEVLAVIGPNGSGKSTLLLTLSRLLDPDDGQILYHGESIYEMDELSYRRRIGLVLQEPLLLDRSVFDNVASGLRFRRLPQKEINRRVMHWLDRLGVSHLSTRPAKKISGGEAQRVSLARAFAIQPEILLLDEPFSALDAPTRTRLLEDFQVLLSSTSITTIFITHDLDEALYLGDRVSVMLEGRLRQTGPPQEVFSAPSDPDVAAFVGVETVVAGRVISCREGQICIKTGNLQLEAVGDIDIGREVLACLRPEDVTLMPAESIPSTESSQYAGTSPPSSARNRFTGQIKRMTPQGPLVKMVIDCGFPLVALITRASAMEMDLSENKAVLVSFKASAVHLIPR